jgi:hypothetical protein
MTARMIKSRSIGFIIDFVTWLGRGPGVGNPDVGPQGLPSQTEFSIGCAVKIDGTLERLVQRVGTKASLCRRQVCPQYVWRRCLGHKRQEIPPL